MSVASAPIQETAERTPKRAVQRGLTIRSFVVCIFAMLLMGMWIEYVENFVTAGGPLGENSPPNGAVGVILILLAISALLYSIRRSLRLTTAELVVIYTALLVAAPLMSQGLWTRMFGLLAAIPHTQDFKSLESYPSMLWPHGPNLVENGRFVGKSLKGYTFDGVGTQDWEDDVQWKGKTWSCPRLNNAADATAESTLTFQIPRYVGEGKKAREVLVPGENYLYSMLVKTDKFSRGSAYFVRMQADENMPTNVIISTSKTKKTFAIPSGFDRVGLCPLTIPRDLKEKLTFTVGLIGPGHLTIHDLELMNVQAIEGLYMGRKLARAKDYDALVQANEYDFTVKKPNNMFSPAGLSYLLHGFIPLRQWAWPALAWSLLIGALFAGFLGFNVIMRKQWVENERFMFPMNIFPRELFSEGGTEYGVTTTSIFRNKVMWIGFVVTMPLLILKGIHFYYPDVPAPMWSDLANPIPLQTYVTDPLLKIFLTNLPIGVPITLLAIALLIEKDLLFSLWMTFVLFQLWFLFGKLFNFNQYSGYPWQWEQAIGSFIAFAVLGIIAARRHLKQVFQHLIGRVKMDDSQEILSYRTAAMLILLSIVTLILWGVWTKMGALAAALFFGYMLICGFTASRVRAECGAPLGYWMPYVSLPFLSALGGFAIFGTTGMLVAAICSGFAFVACFFFIAPVQVEMMELGRHFSVRPRDIHHGLWLGMFGGLLIGGFVLLCWAYGFGADNLTKTWSYDQKWYITNSYSNGASIIDNAYSQALGNAEARSKSPDVKRSELLTPETQPLNMVRNIHAKGIGIGFVITCLFAVLRGLFMWFPLHPIGYVIASTLSFGKMIWFTLFVAWAIRSAVLRIGGAHTVRKGLIPFSVGMFLACITSIILFDVLGFYLRTIGIIDVYSKLP